MTANELTRLVCLVEDIRNILNYQTSRAVQQSSAAPVPAPSAAERPASDSSAGVRAPADAGHPNLWLTADDLYDAARVVEGQGLRYPAGGWQTLADRLRAAANAASQTP